MAATLMIIIQTAMLKYPTKNKLDMGRMYNRPFEMNAKQKFVVKDLVELIQGKVDLSNSECTKYLLEGLKYRYNTANTVILEANNDDAESYKLLAIVVAKGPNVSMYKPSIRICITTTPLYPIASFALCNIAQISRNRNQACLRSADLSLSSLLISSTELTCARMG
jgi:hypothetical protein